MTVNVRPMTESEFDEWQLAIAQEYAEEQVSAGNWSRDGAVERALDENARLLPDGLATRRMLVLRGVDDDGIPVGRAWVGLDHPRGTPEVAFLYDIEVLETRRGSGLGRALLSAVEAATRAAGASALELNVFGGNAVAIGLYDSAGYEVTTQQMRKAL
ncbi:GNAT family N-acetyltransferase [Agromyces endophyticus]|uniref:GNAT family N-acetyltransferase n=1 Tax=Agromyces sp. H17E-10 TaxID=2932244 RepID=UPI001FD42F04|nr:GNAT family N-acetyltransferase [Agromyces sp. H17E-10]UOQ89274.1 GNAT family N-acetyltransferase [Agromyces sp. H17E-10]